MPSAKSEKRAGFYCELPVSTIEKIKKRSSATKPQWVVIKEAIDGFRAVAKKRGGK